MDGDDVPPTDTKQLRRELLVVRCQRGERAAFEELVREWERPLFYYLRRLVKSEADAWDLLQDVWVKVFRSIRTLREPAALAAFLYTVARNAAVSHVREYFLENDADADVNGVESA